MGRANEDTVFALIGLLAGADAANSRSFDVNKWSAIGVPEKRPHPRQAVHDAACLMSRICDSVNSWLTIAPAPTTDSVCEVLLANQCLLRRFFCSKTRFGNNGIRRTTAHYTALRTPTHRARRTGIQEQAMRWSSEKPQTQEHAPEFTIAESGRLLLQRQKTRGCRPPTRHPPTPTNTHQHPPTRGNTQCAAWPQSRARCFRAGTPSGSCFQCHRRICGTKRTTDIAMGIHMNLQLT